MGQSIELDDETALVLFDFLPRWDHESEPLAIQDPSEECALLLLLASLEKTLVEPFKSEYVSLLEDARQSLRNRYGTA